MKRFVTLPRERRPVLIGVILASLAFAANFWIAFELDDLEVVGQYDVMFHADTLAQLKCMVGNKCGGRSAFSHPNLALFLNPPTRLVAGALAQSGYFETGAGGFRRLIALLVCPLASALKAPVVFFFLVALGLSLGQAFALSLLSIASFSQLVFGSIPESFALSGLLIALTYLLAVHTMRGRVDRLWPWIVLGVLTTGVTITNLAIVVMLYVAASFCRDKRPVAILLMTLLLVSSVVATTGALAWFSRDTYQLSEVDIKGGAKYTKRWFKPENFVDRALQTPVAWAHTLAAPEPGVARNKKALSKSKGRNKNAPRDGSKYKFRFSFDSPAVFSSRDPVTLFVLALLVLGASSYWKAPRIGKWIAAASLATIGFNWVLHSAWGVDLFLYSQHWQLSLITLLAGPFLGSDARTRRVALVLLGALVVTVLIQNSFTALAMLSRLQSV